ncbi:MULTISPECIES: hypothetical protein [Halorussus]|uniref:hypothetical protein n=1 Tax=Halorussus TaxID=1070314 RepID=UPI000E20DB69|nr:MULTISPECIES: hypothetical protein [Halorussus]NHN59367.1 hypothetical protein [Halorussus sp. JP-T4]
MGILEIHFHDSEFSWSMNPGGDEGRSFSLGTGGSSEASGATTDGGSTGRPSMGPKLRSAAVLALVVAGGIAFNRIRARRAREAVERETAEQESKGPFSLLRSR